MRGSAYESMELYHYALADYGKSAELNPTDAASYEARGYIYELLGEYELADADYAMAASLED